LRRAAAAGAAFAAFAAAAALPGVLAFLAGLAGVAFLAGGAAMLGHSFTTGPTISRIRTVAIHTATIQAVVLG
jgi:hypothetical protein